MPLERRTLATLRRARVRLLGGHRLDLEANPPLERASLEHRRLGLVLDRPARLTNELVDRGHESVVSLTPEPEGGELLSLFTGWPGQSSGLVFDVRTILNPDLAAPPRSSRGTANLAVVSHGFSGWGKSNLTGAAQLTRRAVLQSRNNEFNPDGQFVKPSIGLNSCALDSPEPGLPGGRYPGLGPD